MSETRPMKIITVNITVFFTITFLLMILNLTRLPAKNSKYVSRYSFFYFKKNRRKV